MGKLNITLIDAGWGDSIFIEHIDEQGNPHYGLIDSNDTKEIKSTQIFIKRFFSLKRIDTPSPLFDFILLSHPHDDHMSGIKGIMQKFGTRYFLHPKSHKLNQNSLLMKYCANPRAKVEQYDAAHTSKELPVFGDVEMKTLWPHDGRISNNENNNSVVISMKYGNSTVLLTGDAEQEVWDEIASKIPMDTVFFKVPHHGSRNGSLDPHGRPTWLRQCPAEAMLGISCMFRRDYRHPHDIVLQEFISEGRKYYRTDMHYHITVSMDGVTAPKVKYSHV